MGRGGEVRRHRARNHAMILMLIGMGCTHAELVGLRLSDLTAAVPSARARPSHAMKADEDTAIEHALRERRGQGALCLPPVVPKG
jgi:integrase